MIAFQRASQGLPPIILDIAGAADYSVARVVGYRVRELRGGRFEDRAYLPRVAVRIGREADTFERSNRVRIARLLDAQPR